MPFTSRDLAEWLFLLILAATFAWRAFVPGWRSLNTDFPNYYLMARLYRQGYPLGRQYEWIWFQRQKDHAGIKQPLVSSIPLTPFSALVVLPFSSLSPLEAKRCWLVVNLMFLILTGCLLDRMTALGARRVAIITLLAIVPLRDNFLTGQLHVLMLFLLTLSAYFYFKGWLASSGAPLALAAGLKIYPLLFLIYFLRKKLWRAATALLTGCVGVALLSVWLFGMETVRVYVVHVLPRALAGESNDPYSVAWNSFTALLRRLFIAEPELNPHPLIHSLGAYVVLQPFCQALLFLPFCWLMKSSRTDAAREKLEWGGYVAMLLILSTNPAPYHYCVLILTAVLAADALRGAGRPRQAALLIILYSLACIWPSGLLPRNPAGWHTLLAFPRLYALTALWGFFLWALKTRSGGRLGLQVTSSDGVFFATMFLGLIALGTVSNLRHLRGQSTNYRSRLFVRPGSLMAVEPAVSGNKVFFTALGDTGYIIGIYNRGRVYYIVPRTDAFHPTAALDATLAWAELASTRSRIFRLTGIASASRAESTDVKLHDEEGPAVSADGKLLAFIRERTGRGSLWVKETGRDRPDFSSDPAGWEVASADYNVCDLAFFPDGRIILAAEPHGVPELFIADPISHHVTPFPDSGLWERYPAVSPDGKWLAYSKQEGGNWHLWVRKIRPETGKDEGRRLTAGECNSITPAWFSDSKTLVYATDCGRGLGLTALCRIQAVP